MRCVTCNKGTMRPGLVELQREVGDHVFTTLTDGRTCSACGEVEFEGESLARFELAIAVALARSGANSGEAFRWMRKAVGLRAIDAAEILGVTPETVSRWETGRVAIAHGALALLSLIIEDHVRGSTATIEVLRARAAAKPLGKQVKIKLAS